MRICSKEIRFGFRNWQLPMHCKNIRILLFVYVYIWCFLEQASVSGFPAGKKVWESSQCGWMHDYTPHQSCPWHEHTGLLFAIWGWLADDVKNPGISYSEFLFLIPDSRAITSWSFMLFILQRPRPLSMMSLWHHGPGLLSLIYDISLTS